MEFIEAFSPRQYGTLLASFLFREKPDAEKKGQNRRKNR